MPPRHSRGVSLFTSLAYVHAALDQGRTGTQRTDREIEALQPLFTPGITFSLKSARAIQEELYRPSRLGEEMRVNFNVGFLGTSGESEEPSS